MDDEIKIFDSNDKNFGLLSNNYRYPMFIDRYQWNTVTHYIYANMLLVPNHRKVISKTSLKDIQQETLNLYQEEFIDLLKISLDKALTAKFTSEEMIELLLSTGDSEIIYVSDNDFLGIGTNKAGNNYYGKSLMKIRETFKINKNINFRRKQDVDFYENLYQTYNLFRHLEILAEKNPEYLQYFFGKNSIEDIRNVFITKSIDFDDRKFQDREKIIDMLKRGSLSEVKEKFKNPAKYIFELLKKNENKILNRLLFLRNKKVFYLYTDYILEKYYSHLDKSLYDLAKEQAFSNITSSDINTVGNRIFILYKKSCLSDRLPKIMDEVVPEYEKNISNFIKIMKEENNNFTGPVFDDFDDFDMRKVPGEKNKPELGFLDNILLDMGISSEENTAVKDSQKSITFQKKKIYIYPENFGEISDEYRKYVKLSPVYMEMMTIDKMLYPSVTHYITTSLISQLPSIKTIKNAYIYILKNPNTQVSNFSDFKKPDEILQDYNNLKNRDFNMLLIKNAEIAMDKKFENTALQDVLLVTGETKLIYNDKSSEVLGIGKDGNGLNFVGNYLVKLREQYKLIRKTKKIEVLNDGDIVHVLKSDLYIKNWLENKIQGMCKVVKIMKNYMELKYEKPYETNSSFTQNVIDIIYQPCTDIFVNAGKVKYQAPEYFRTVVSNCKSVNLIEYDTIELLWKRIYIMVSYLMIYMSANNIFDLKKAMIYTQLMLSNKIICKKIVNDDFINCIISAILNLIINMRKFEKKYSAKVSKTVTQKQIDCIVAIILNIDISFDNKLILKDKDTTEDLEKIPDVLEEEQKRYDVDEEQEMDENLSQVDYDYPEEENMSVNQDTPPIAEEEFDFLNDDDNYAPPITSNDIPPLFAELQKMEIENPDKASELIFQASNIIKNYRMNPRDKNTRINFFASIHS